MRTPGFWYRPPGLAAALLAPLGALYGVGGWLRRARTRPAPAGVPVVCVGNLVAGGAGKTPVAIAVVEALKALGHTPHVLTRGHGGRLKGPVAVDVVGHDAGAVGDEALLLVRHAPTWVAADRVAGAAAAVAAGADVVVLDDGLQNPALAKDLSLVVVDGGVGFGNGRLIPAGPLRESVAAGLRRAAGAVVVVGEDRAGVESAIKGWPSLRARLEPTAEAPDLRGVRVLAFAGIGRPEKFFATLEALGALVVERIGFADHHPYGAAEVARLIERAGALGAQAVTTAKDRVRLPATARDHVAALPVRLVWEEPAALAALLARLWRDPASLGGGDGPA